MNLTNIMFGEVVDAYPPSSVKNQNKYRFEYDVRVYVQGSAIIVRNAIVTEPFSGVDNFQEIRLRTSSDESGSGDELFSTDQEGKRKVGDRVLLVNPDNNSATPIIIGTLPYLSVFPEENQTPALVSAPVFVNDTRPQLRGRYNGFNYRIDAEGQARFQHSGAPDIKIEQGLFASKQAAPIENITTLDFLKLGGFRLVDNNQQGIVIDSQKQYISLNNTTTAPDDKFTQIAEIEINETSDGSAPKGQEIRLDQANKRLSLLSSDVGQVITGGDFLMNILGNRNTEVSGDETQVISGDFSETIGGSQNVKVSGGDLTYDVKGVITFTSKTGAKFEADSSGNMTLSAADGSKIELGPSGSINITAQKVQVSAGTVDVGSQAQFGAVLGEQLKAWTDTHTHPTALGPSGPPTPPLPDTAISQTVKVQP